MSHFVTDIRPHRDGTGPRRARFARVRRARVPERLAALRARADTLRAAAARIARGGNSGVIERALAGLLIAGTVALAARRAHALSFGGAHGGRRRRRCRGGRGLGVGRAADRVFRRRRSRCRGCGARRRRSAPATSWRRAARATRSRSSRTAGCSPWRRSPRGARARLGRRAIADRRGARRARRLGGRHLGDRDRQPRVAAAALDPHLAPRGAGHVGRREPASASLAMVAGAAFIAFGGASARRSRRRSSRWSVGGVPRRDRRLGGGRDAAGAALVRHMRRRARSAPCTAAAPRRATPAGSRWWTTTS